MVREGQGLARYLMTGVSRPVDHEEREARWQDSPPATPKKDRDATKLLDPGPGSPVTSSTAESRDEKNVGRHLHVAKYTPQAVGQTVLAAAFQKPRIPVMEDAPVNRVGAPPGGPKGGAILQGKFSSQDARDGPNPKIEGQQASVLSVSTSKQDIIFPSRPFLSSDRNLRGRLPQSELFDSGAASSEDQNAAFTDPRGVASVHTSVHQQQARIDAEFAALLDRMQVDAVIRSKMATTDTSVKQAMLRSVAMQDIPPAIPPKGPSTVGADLGPAVSGRRSPHPLRQSKSNGCLRDGEGLEQVFCVSTDSLGAPPKSLSTSLGPSKTPRTPSFSSRRPGGSPKKASGASSTQKDPGYWSVMLKTTSVAELLPSSLIHLRVHLRNELPAWTAEWARLGGYRNLLERLSDILEMEWRQEQHDDQLLHEMLRCLKALLTTEVGRALLGVSAPAPFRSLMELLYSEKKPGDLPLRQCIIEIITGLFDVFPPSTGAPMLNPQEWGTKLDLSSIKHLDILEHMRSKIDFVRGPSVSCSAEQLVHTLLLGPPDDQRETTIDFIRSIHQPRIFGHWMDEVTGTLSDYFWIFCHQQPFEELRENFITRSSVPSGMSSGVEAIAMSYILSHLRLVNVMLSCCKEGDDARSLLRLLFGCGFENILLTVRKCSTAYYPQVHQEMARLFAQAKKVDFTFPACIQRHIP